MLAKLRTQLPDDWLVVTNVAWSLRLRNGWVRDGQADFVVLAPGLGMAVVEVKGSAEFWVEDDGRWFRREYDGRAERIDEPPPAQAQKNMYALVEIARQKLGWETFPAPFSYLVAYPNGEASSLPPMLDATTFVTRKHMHGLVSRIRGAIEARGEGSLAVFDRDTALRAARLFANHPFSISRTDTGADAADDHAAIDRLTAQQAAALRGVFDFPRIAVLGPAGSGKTVLAMWRLKALVDAGKRAQYVCFNTSLAALLRARNPAYAHAIQHVDKFLHDVAKVASLPVLREAGSKDFFSERLPSAIHDWASSVPASVKMEAFVIDEGQDFNDLRLYALLELLEPTGGQWAFFADWRQNLYGTGLREAIGAEATFKLHHNCRNPVRVNDSANRLLPHPVESMPGMPPGVEPTIEAVGSRKALASRVWELAREWSVGGTVAVLSPFVKDNSSMKDESRGHGLRLVDKPEQLGEAGTVYFSTVKSFKGMEAASVILVDAIRPGSSEAFGVEDFYVACTRPTARLAVLSSDATVVEWGRRRWGAADAG